MTMRRSAATFAVVTVTAAVTAAGAIAPAQAGTANCVGGSGCRSSLQEAVDEADPGDVIRIAPGIYAGGVHIAKSLTLVGAGAARTVIRGGGPVLTIGDGVSTVPPTVVLDGLTVTGGVTHGLTVFAGGPQTNDRFNAFGGGIWIPPGPDVTPGATVTLRGVVVSGNRTAPTATSPVPSDQTCPAGPCPVANTRGGGIASFGRLTLERSVVTGNRAVGPASDATGGGIFAAEGTLTLRSSAVVGNTAAPERIGRFAEGGGIFAANSVTTVVDSTISGNSAELVATWPIRPQGVLLDLLANGGGVHIAHGGTLTMADSRIEANRVLADDPAAEILAFGTGLLADDGAVVSIRRSSLSHNRQQVRTATSEDVGPSGMPVEIDTEAELTDVQISGNSTEVTAAHGQAIVGGGLGAFGDNPQRLVLTRVAIHDNTSTARSLTGSAVGVGGGIVNNAQMDLRSVTVQGNTVAALAPTAFAQGGGIINGPLLFDQSVELTATGSRITGNLATTRPGGDAQGGGVFSFAPLTLTGTVIAGNRPDQCVGCTPGATTLRTRTFRLGSRRLRG